MHKKFWQNSALICYIYIKIKKTLSMADIEGTKFNMIKPIYDKMMGFPGGSVGK